MEIIGALFQAFLGKMTSPCTADIVEIAKKALKSFTEGKFKLGVLKCCVEVVRSKPGNLGMTETLKVAMRAMGVGGT